MKSRTRKKLKGSFKAFVASALACALTITAIPAVTAFAGTIGGKYYSDYTTYDEAIEEAGKINLEVSEEGSVLLKNDGTLPLKGSELISVFGVGSSVLVGGSNNTNSVANPPDTSDRGPIYDSLVEAGFRVNGVLADWYSNNTSGASQIGTEPYGTEFSAAVRSTFGMFNDVAVVVISRNAGEGSDANMVTSEVEDNKYGDEDQGWRHDALYKAKKYNSSVAGRSEDYDAKSETEYKHYLQLTDSEEGLIKYVEGIFKKVVVVLNTANAMEVYNLREDDKVNGILLMGRPGETGHYAVGEILAGTVNPSGKLVDEWNTDFTADPTWNNFGYGDQAGSQNMYYYGEYGTSVKTYNSDATVRDGNDITYGSHNQSGYYGVDYEEDIYLGYNYWETKYYEIYKALCDNGSVEVTGNGKKITKLSAANAAEAAQVANEWYSKNVAYSFGYGLSYSSFSLNIVKDGIYATGGKDNATKVTGSLSDLMTVDNLKSNVGSPAKVKTLYIPVKVTNTGKFSGKEVVEIYVTAPFTGELEKSFVTLSGYAKTDILRPGESQTVWVQVNVQDFASFDYEGKVDGTTGYTLEKGNYVIRAMNTAHYDVATDPDDVTDAYDQITFDLLEDNVHQLLDDFSDNLAEALFSEEYGTDGVEVSTDEEHHLVYQSIRTKDLAADDESCEVLLTRNTILSYFPEAPTEGDLTLKTEVIDNWDYWNNFDTEDLEGDDWYKAATDIPDTWTQGTGVADENGQYEILITDMLGLPLYDDNGNMTKEWVEFMNQLTVQELKDLVERQKSMWTSTAMATIGKLSSTQADSYNDVRTAGGTFLWTDSPTLSATWNVDLAERVGKSRGNIEVLNGWSAWGGKEMDTHRSPFSGRNAEYLSQDGIQGGYIAAAFCKGMESKGVTCYIKHFALNDMETCRDGMCNNVWASEQAVRQINFKVFQMAMQEGGASASMTGFARLCGVPMNANNAVLEKMVVNEWGWDGFWITDGYSGVSKCTTMESMMRGYCIPLPLGSQVPTILGEWNADRRDGKGNVDIVTYETKQVPDTDEAGNELKDEEGNTVMKEIKVEVDRYESATQYYYLRMTAARILYADAKSNDVANGYATSYIGASKKLETTQGDALSAELGIYSSKGVLQEADVVYTLTKGALPAGVSLSSDGTISGTPTESGEFSFTVTAVIDGWVDGDIVKGLTKTFDVKVASAFSIDEEGDALDSAEVGKKFYSAIVSDTYKVGEEYTSVKYELTSGDLDAYGLTLSEDGVIEGTPTKTGTIQFTVKITASKQSSSGGNNQGWGGQGGMPGGNQGGPGGMPGGNQGGGNSSSGTSFTYSGTIVIGGEDPVTPPVEEDPILTKSEVEALIDAALKGQGTSSSGCSGSVQTELFALTVVLAAAGVVVATVSKKRKENEDK